MLHGHTETSPVSRSSWLVHAGAHAELVVVVTMPTRSKVVLVLSKLNTRAFRSIKTTINTMVDLAIVKKGSKVPIATAAETLPLHCRSISVELELDEGEYFVYVRSSLAIYSNPHLNWLLL